MSFKSSPLFVLPILALATPVANAADYVEPAPDFVPKTYISAEGGIIWTDHGIREDGDDKFGDIDDDDNGFYAAITARRMFNPSWDIQLTGTGTWLDGASQRADPDGADYRYNTDLDFQTIDLDVGYHPMENPMIRLLLGLRVLHVDDELTYSDTNPFAGDHFASFDSNGWAVGPRIGIQSEMMLGDSKFGLIAEGSGSILFGKFDEDWENFNGPSGSDNDSRTVYNLEGLAGLSYHCNENFAITIGYRAQKWWDLRENTGVSFDNGYSLTADPDVLVHGPFARVGLTF